MGLVNKFMDIYALVPKTQLFCSIIDVDKAATVLRPWRRRMMYIYKQLALVFLQQKSKKAGKLDLMSNFPAGRLFGFCGGYGECLFDEADDELFLTDLLAQSLGLAGEVCLQPLEEFLGNLQC